LEGAICEKIDCANEAAACVSVMQGKLRKRGIRQRKGVPPLRKRRMPRLTTCIATDGPNRNRALLLKAP